MSTLIILNFYFISARKENYLFSNRDVDVFILNGYMWKNVEEFVDSTCIFVIPTCISVSNLFI